MTREEAIFHLKQFKKRLHLDDTEEYIINTDSIDMAIEALSGPTTVTEWADRCRECGRIGNYIHKSVLDKIRAEIIDKYMTADGRMGSVSADILKIIDKHISGKE